MNKKSTWYGCLTLVGGLLFVLSLVLGDSVPKQVGGLLTGIGCGLFAGCGVQWRMRKQEEKNPDMARRNSVEQTDERTVVIRDRAKAAAGDILQWCVMGVAFFTIAVDAPVWVTLTAVGLFLLYNILILCFQVKYQKEL